MQVTYQGRTHPWTRDLIVQAVCFGEHTFHRAVVLADDGTMDAIQTIEGKWLRVPGARERHPSVSGDEPLCQLPFLRETPWASPRDYPALIRGREEYAEIFSSVDQDSRAMTVKNPIA